MIQEHALLANEEVKVLSSESPELPQALKHQQQDSALNLGYSDEPGNILVLSVQVIFRLGLTIVYTVRFLP